MPPCGVAVHSFHVMVAVMRVMAVHLRSNASQSPASDQRAQPPQPLEIHAAPSPCDTRARHEPKAQISSCRWSGRAGCLGACAGCERRRVERGRERYLTIWPPPSYQDTKSTSTMYPLAAIATLLLAPPAAAQSYYYPPPSLPGWQRALIAIVVVLVLIGAGTAIVVSDVGGMLTHTSSALRPPALRRRRRPACLWCKYTTPTGSTLSARQRTPRFQSIQWSRPRRRCTTVSRTIRHRRRASRPTPPPPRRG